MKWIKFNYDTGAFTALLVKLAEDFALRKVGGFILAIGECISQLESSQVTNRGRGGQQMQDGRTCHRSEQTIGICERNPHVLPRVRLR